MTTWESTPDGELLIARQGFDVALVGDVREECADLFKMAPGYHLHTDPKSTGQVERITCPVDELDCYPAITHAARHLTEEQVLVNFVANRQAPFALQRFHSDSKNKPVVVLHLDDEGSLDYIDRSTRSRMTIVAGRGDLVIQAKAGLVHRGRNRGSLIRHTAGFYTVQRFLRRRNT